MMLGYVVMQLQCYNFCWVKQQCAMEKSTVVGHRKRSGIADDLGCCVFQPAFGCCVHPKAG